jgi:hypothetical protein
MQRCFCLLILCTTISADECYPRPFLFSQALYSAMGVHDCGWWLGRDIATVVWWAISLCAMYTTMDTREAMSLKVFFLLLVGGLIWELVVILFYAVAIVYFFYLFLESNGCINAHPTTNRIEPIASGVENHGNTSTTRPATDFIPAAVVPTALVPPAVAVVSAFRQSIDVAAVSIDLPIQKAQEWKHV